MCLFRKGRRIVECGGLVDGTEASVKMIELRVDELADDGLETTQLADPIVDLEMS